jgi:opacity protein-like surface antigen
MARTPRQLLRSAATVAGALTAVAGVSLVAMPAASAAEASGAQAAASTFDMYDVDRNGWYDPYVADESGNGYLDRNVIDVNGVYLWLFDRDEDGRPDAYGTDNNNDGWSDVWGYDWNEDYVVDSWDYDRAVHAQPSTFAVSVTIVWSSQPAG